MERGVEKKWRDEEVKRKVQLKKRMENKQKKNGVMVGDKREASTYNLYLRSV